MKTLNTAAALTRWRRALDREAVTVGFVPTMGALHEGHRALIRAARLKCDAVVVSVFVNPTQFGPREDYARYPRRLRDDATVCRREGIDVLFAPSAEQMYPDGFGTTVAVGSVTQRWEGERRPGHFDGVATIVTKLLGLVRPHVALFGQKDYQQCAVVRRLVADLSLDTHILVHPTVREADGLAMSSRNVFLDPPERQAATVLYRALQAGWKAIRRKERSGPVIQRLMENLVAAEPLAKLDYLAVCDPMSLEPVDRIRGRAVLLGAIRIGSVRLIDNVLASGPR
jgi:pantoate--beta-alanine ligase